jgi:hypothetical protein
MGSSKGAENMEEAVRQFYDTPDKYSQDLLSANSKTANHTKETKMRTDAPPTYNQSSQAVTRPRHRHHTNAVIEAGLIRARDEVRFALIPTW